MEDVVNGSSTNVMAAAGQVRRQTEPMCAFSSFCPLVHCRAAVLLLTIHRPLPTPLSKTQLLIAAIVTYVISTKMKREVLAACQAESNAKRSSSGAKGASYEPTWTDSGCSDAASRSASPLLPRMHGAASPLHSVVVHSSRSSSSGGGSGGGGGAATTQPAAGVEADVFANADADGGSRPSSPMEPLIPGEVPLAAAPAAAPPPPSARVARAAHARHRRSYSAGPSVIALMQSEAP